MNRGRLGSIRRYEARGDTKHRVRRIKRGAWTGIPNDTIDMIACVRMQFTFTFTANRV